MVNWITVNRFIEKIFLIELNRVFEAERLHKYTKKYEKILKYAVESSYLNNCFYIYKYNVLSTNEESITFIINYINSLPRIISIEERYEAIQQLMNVGCSESTAKRIISMEFSEGGLFACRSGVQLQEKYDCVLQNHFKSGIHVYDSSEIGMFKNYVLTDFGDDITDKSDRALIGVIVRIGFLVGRGIYVSEKNASQLSDKLAKEIKRYIDNTDAPIFMTNSLFGVFEDKLLLENITNKYHLQAALRKRYDEDWTFRRDYISKDPAYTNIYSSIISFINTSNVPISKDDLFEKFYGVPEVVINFATADYDIINLFGEYIHSSKLKLTDANIYYIKIKILERIGDSSFCNMAQVYEDINFEYPELLTNNFVKFPFSLFSLVQYLYPDEFIYARPYIGLKNSEIAKPEEIALQMLDGVDIFDINELFDFLKSEGAKINSQLDFINLLNSTHMLVNNNQIASISYIGVSKEFTENLENEIIKELNGTIAIDHLQCLKTLPQINVDWNAWLIYSMIKKWGSKLQVGTSDSQFRLSVPLISLLGLYDSSNVIVNAKQRDGNISVGDDFGRIDDLLEDISIDEI